MEAETRKAKAKAAKLKEDAAAEKQLLDHWVALAKTAGSQKLNDTELLTLLTQGRSEGKDVKAKLLAGTQHLVFEKGFHWTSRSNKRRFEDISGPLTLGHDEAIDDLLKNDRTDVQKAISDELNRSIVSFRRDQSPTIYVNSSTKSRRKKLGQPEYKNLTQSGACLTDAFDEDEATIVPYLPTNKGPFTDQTGDRFIPPSKYLNEHDDFALIDLLDELPDAWHREVAEMLFDERTQQQIADATGRTVYAVAKASAVVEVTLERFWEPRDRAVEPQTAADPALTASTRLTEIEPCVSAAEHELYLSA